MAFSGPKLYDSMNNMHIKIYSKASYLNTCLTLNVEVFQLSSVGLAY